MILLTVSGFPRPIANPLVPSGIRGPGGGCLANPAADAAWSILTVTELTLLLLPTLFEWEVVVPTCTWFPRWWLFWWWWWYWPPPRPLPLLRPQLRPFFGPPPSLSLKCSSPCHTYHHQPHQSIIYEEYHRFLFPKTFIIAFYHDRSPEVRATLRISKNHHKCHI